jgi:hypothetical protein
MSSEKFARPERSRRTWAEKGRRKTWVALSDQSRPVRPWDMEAILDNKTSSPTTRSATVKTWTARVLTSLFMLFLLIDGAGKVLRLAPYVEGTARVGYPASCLIPLGLVLVACAILYVVPRTAILGAVLLTAYLGGATATHVRMGEPFFFPVVFGVLLWACLYMRDARVRALLMRPRDAGETA